MSEMLPLWGSSRQSRLRGSLPALALILPLLSACAPKPEATAPAAIALDCAQPFDAQSAAITAQPGLVPAPKEAGEPYRFYTTADGHVSYVVTEPGAPGHPALIRQDATGGQMKTTGCAYGNKRGYEQLRAYLDSLKTWSRR